MCYITKFKAVPTPLVSRNEPAMQRINLICHASCDAHLLLAVIRNNQKICASYRFSVNAGDNEVAVMLPVGQTTSNAHFILSDLTGNIVSEFSMVWHPPREWTLYVIKSSHTDIGLHNSQYIQRDNCSRFLDKAMKLCDKTSTWSDAERYRYVVEGTWFWNNYCDDQGENAARNVIDNYVRSKQISIGGATAGNHTQVYGMEEMCRSTYTRSRLKNEWGIDTKTMTMVDNNGMSWSTVIPYAEAGFKNIFFAPNHWNPLPSTIWPKDNSVEGGKWNPDASGGGARIDVRYDSALPMVFYWQGANEESKVLVWCSTHYEWGGTAFGVTPNMQDMPNFLTIMAEKTARQLIKLEEKCPYDTWLFACYGDDEEPNLKLNEVLQEWNSKWRWPEIRTVGDLDEPFDRIRSKHDSQIPVISGDITGGWYQHPVATPELLAQKFAVDRLLPTAEILATLAGIYIPEYQYPVTEFRRAWDALICNDEHSYGVSGYKGRRVYETWLQHRDWIDKAEAIAINESSRAFKVIASHISAAEPSLVVFNPTLQKRSELIDFTFDNGNDIRLLTPEIPSLGYIVIPISSTNTKSVITENEITESPILENRFYRIHFAEDGSISSLFDKDLLKELIDTGVQFKCNQFVYTKDNHENFVTPLKAEFQIERDSYAVTIIATTMEPVSGASIKQRVTIFEHEKRIDIDNSLNHVQDLINKDRYYRYGYFAFPFSVNGSTPKVQLNGCIASPGKDQTGHGTETYLAGREWCCVENDEFGVALFQLDSQLLEFGKIHSDKTDCYLPTSGSAIYSYVFNDWLQMHTPGGSHINPHFRYSIVSYSGDFSEAGIPQISERLAHPVISDSIDNQTGFLPPDNFSFLETGNPNLSLLALKRAEDGNGIIARFWENSGHGIKNGALSQKMAPEVAIKRCAIDEQMHEGDFDLNQFGLNKHDYLTLRLAGINLAERPETAQSTDTGCPAPIGSVYTGLVTIPRAVCGEFQGHLYLEWGQNMESDLSHYELYRSENLGFNPSRDTFVTEVTPGPYRVACFEDKDLRTHTQYYYRVRAVNRIGKCSEFSDEFSGLTRE